MIINLGAARKNQSPVAGLSPCENRTVSKDGRIVCKKIVEGDNEVSPNTCRACPFKAINCGNLRFSLRQISPSPIIVRFNGREETWNDDPPELRFERAACSAKVIPIEHPRACVACPLRQPIQAPNEAPARKVRLASGSGKVVPFPSREAAAAAG